MPLEWVGPVFRKSRMIVVLGYSIFAGTQLRSQSELGIDFGVVGPRSTRATTYPKMGQIGDGRVIGVIDPENAC